jgi:hypothetical protein
LTARPCAEIGYLLPVAPPNPEVRPVEVPKAGGTVPETKGGIVPPLPPPEAGIDGGRLVAGFAISWDGRVPTPSIFVPTFTSGWVRESSGCLTVCVVSTELGWSVTTLEG